MDLLAHKALSALLRLADRHDAGVASRSPTLTPSHLKNYHALRSLPAKEAFEGVLKHAQDVGAVRLTWPAHQPDGYLQRVELKSASLLASLLNQVPLAERLAAARQTLSPKATGFQVLHDVLEQWAALRRVRGTSPDDAATWSDACTAIEHCRAEVAAGRLETSVRDASARIFRDSKRIEALIPSLDVLLTGSVEAPARQESEVLQELGLFKEQQPARLAGHVIVRRERGTFVLDRPYCALPPATVLGLGSKPLSVLTIENQTTFHAQARVGCDTGQLLLFTAGMPSPAWRGMYMRLLRTLPVGVPVAHWGDFDEGGFRIAAYIARAAVEAGHTLAPHRMHPDDIRPSQRRSTTERTVDRMATHADEARWSEIALAIRTARFVAEQEG